MILNVSTFHLLRVGDRLRYYRSDSSDDRWWDVKVTRIHLIRGERDSFRFIDMDRDWASSWIPSAGPLDAWEWRSLVYDGPVKWFDIWLPPKQEDK